MRILVTGGTGTLGRATVDALRGPGVVVRVLSRAAAPAGWDGVEWAQGEFTTGTGLADAVRDVDVVVHAAHDRQSPDRDAAGVGELLRAATAAGVARVVYVSIVGARDVPGVAYYRGKAAGERLALASGIGAVFRATQFFDFVDGMLGALDRFPAILVLPRGLRFQPVDVAEAAAALARFAAAPGVREGALAGPEVLTIEALARSWLAARGARKRVVAVPVPFGAVREIASGALTAAAAAHGEVTWERGLARRRGAPGAGQRG
jgi:uncharacterized protein YbjT (DUF2867 family)